MTCDYDLSKSNKYNAVIEAVDEGSIADECGLCAGDRVISINGEALRDIIDYRLMCADEYLELEIMPEDGTESYILEIEKDYDEELGITFTEPVFDRIRTCCNHCIFCFVDQMVPGQRRTLYVKDDDYRMSFLFGSYITLTNIGPSDIARIEQQHLSPLYISVHATEKSYRKQLLGREDKIPLEDILRELSDHGIIMHGQVVLCPGINDGPVLAKTIKDVAAVEGFQSLALVPVGLTRYKNPELNPFTREEAEDVLDAMETFQSDYHKRRGTRFVFAADELYLRAKRKLPSYEEYEDFPQLENGVGIIALFNEEFKEKRANIKKPSVDTVLGVITGCDGYEGIRPALEYCNGIAKLTVKPVIVRNGFFGDSVTVTGLLTGHDIIEALKEREEDTFLLPDILLKAGTDKLLDDITPEQIAEETGKRIVIAETGGAGLIEALNKIIK